jgi:hypothetical protein
MLEDRMRGNDRRGRDYGDYPSDHRDYRGRMEYRGEIEHDGRRGRYGMRDREEDYRGDYRGGDIRGGDMRGGDMRGDYRGDYRSDYRRDYGHNEMKLSKSDMKRWKRMLKNSDGSRGEHFTADQMREVLHQIDASYEEYDEAELCMTANMLYSDLNEALHSVIPKEREAMTYAKMAKCWLEDEDGPPGSEKLALYYYCIVEGDE